MDEALHETLLRLARAFDRRPPREPRRPSSSSTAGAPEPGSRPGDKYCGPQGPDWHKVLTPAGWTPVRQVGDKVLWRRPGKSVGWSATTGFCRSGLRGDLLYVFSSNAAPFEPETSYSKFEAYAQLHHEGDYSAAAEELAQDERYGGRGETLHGVHFTSANGTSPPSPEQPPGEGTVPEEPKLRWPRPIPASQLTKRSTEAKWIWHGYVSRGGVTLLSAFWKAGKTTLLAYLLRAFETKGLFCGKAVQPCRVLYVSEEDEGTWADRRDLLGLHDHLEFLPRPLRMRPTLLEWREFIGYLAELVRDRSFDVVIFDTIGKMWSVRKENDATEVDNALMPLYSLTELNAAVVVVHHLRKSDGPEATASRGSGALLAFPETIVELRRYDRASLTDSRRVLTGYGRFTETPPELVIDKVEDGYKGLGDPESLRDDGLIARIRAVLGPTEPGKTQKQIIEEVGAKRDIVIAALKKGVRLGHWLCSGTGGKGSPFLYRLAASPEEEERARMEAYSEITLCVGTPGHWTAQAVAQHLRREEQEVATKLEWLVHQGFLGADETVSPIRYYVVEQGPTDG